MVKESLCPRIDKVSIFSANLIPMFHPRSEFLFLGGDQLPTDRGKGVSITSYRGLIDETNPISIYSI